MKAFEFDQAIIDEYASFSRSFTKIRAEDLQEAVNQHYSDKKFWPSPYLALNPAYEKSKTVKDFATSGTLTFADMAM